MDGGETTIKEQLNHVDAIYYITHPYNLGTGSDPETTIKAMRGFGNLIKENNFNVKQLTLVTPVGPYDLNHSVLRKKRGSIIEQDFLKMYISDLAYERYNEIITIASHSDTTRFYAQLLYGINFREINPFRGPAGVYAGRLGPFFYKNKENTLKRDDWKDQLDRLMPFHSILKEKYGDNLNDLFYLAGDEGIYKIVRGLAYALKGNDDNILAIIKDRIGHGRSKIKRLGHDSTATLAQAKDKSAVTADDRGLSFNTMLDNGVLMKRDNKLGYLIGMLAHDLAISPEVLDMPKNVEFPFDELYVLETHPNTHLKDHPKIIRLDQMITALLLAAEIYDSYVRLRETGELPYVR